MQSQWNNEEAEKHGNDLRSLRVYASGLLSDLRPELTAFSTVKIKSESLFGESQTQLFANHGKKVVFIDPAKPLLPQTLLHIAIPARFVEQVRSAAILAIANHANLESIASEAFGGQAQIAPRSNSEQEQADAIRSFDLSETGGILAPGVGLLTFSDNAQESYENAIKLHNAAMAYFIEKATQSESPDNEPSIELHTIADLRKTVSNLSGHAVIAIRDVSAEALQASKHEALNASPQVDESDSDFGLANLDGIQRVVWPNRGVVNFGASKDAADQVAVDTKQICQAIHFASATGGWDSLSADPLASIKTCKGPAGILQGKIALVSGSAAGIGLATATTLTEAGATVVGADINPEIESIMSEIGALGVTVDLTKEDQIEALVTRIVGAYGGLDIVVSNAGIFTAGAYIEDMDANNWDRSMAVNLTSHQVLLKHAIPFLKKGVDSTIIFIGSRNVNAPGAGAASYSCAKAALTQLCRVAALELAPEGVRVNIIHPDAVFDTKLWTKEALERSAERYGLTVEQYKKRNLMKTEITSRSVGNTVVAVASNAFAKTTGAQIPVDGGNDRII